MNRRLGITLCLAATMLAAACSNDDGTVSPGADTVLTVDCVPGAPGCAELVIAGDAPYVLPNGTTSPFGGFADPSLRKDPASPTIWMVYSWPHYRFANGRQVPSVETHLARSSDSGATWTFVKSLWPGTPATNPAGTGGTGELSHEAPNILPVVDGSAVIWYGVRLDYFTPDSGGGLQAPSFHIRVMKAGSPEELSNAPASVLGARLTTQGWGLTQRLTGLNDAVADVDLWNEPALYYENGTLYLVLVAFVYGADNAPVMSRNNIYVFATTPTGPAPGWVWEYRGMLSGAAEAAELGGERMTQVEIARAADGSLLLIESPDDWNSTFMDFNHKGLKVVAIASLNPPMLRRGGDGKLQVRAAVTVSDAGPLGSAAGAYDPVSRAGLLITRRVKTPTQFTARIWRTGLRP